MYTRTLEIRCNDCERQFQMQTLVDSKTEPLDVESLGIVCPTRLQNYLDLPHPTDSFTILSNVIMPFDIGLPLPANVEVRHLPRDTAMEAMIEQWRKEEVEELAAQAEEIRQEEEERFFNEALASFQATCPQGTREEFQALYPELRRQIMLRRTMQGMTDRPERLF